MWQTVFDIGLAAWGVLAEMAPYLLLGFLIAGLLYVFIPTRWVERHLGQRGPWQAIKATLLGIPLPLCSCGVLPVAASLRQHGAGKGATTAFLAATPQTGVDSIAVTWALLGPVFAVYRVIAAFVTGAVAGLTVDALDRPQAEPPQPERQTAASAAAGHRLARVLRYGFVTLPGDIGKALLVGILVSGIMGALLPPGFVPAGMGQGLAAMVIIMLAGIPVYVCSTASVPIALALIQAGFSPGAALVFLVTGPATNVATLATLWKVLGSRATITFLAAIAGCALAAGWTLDLFLSAGETIEYAPMHAMQPALWQHASALLLLAILLNALRPAAGQAPPTHARTLADGQAATNTVNLDIEGMHCSHCAGSVERGLSEVAGVVNVNVDLERGEAAVQHRGAATEQMLREVQALGYSASLKSG